MNVAENLPGGDGIRQHIGANCSAINVYSEEFPAREIELRYHRVATPEVAFDDVFCPGL